MQKPTKSTIDLDIRYFRRYPLEVDCQIKINNKSFWVHFIDYSFMGLGFVTKEPITLKIGDVIDLHVDELNLHQQGKVQWTKPLNAHIRGGILKLGSVAGSFQYYKLSDILIGLQKTLKTGVLDITHGNVKKKIHIKNGNLIFATSNQNKDRLGNILLK